MRRYIVFIRCSFLCFLCLQPPAFCQESNPKADSLINLINTIANRSEKLELYGKLSWAYLSTRTQLEAGRFYADSLRFLAEELNNEKWVMRSHFYYGAYDGFNGDYASALDHLEKYVDYFTHAGDSNWVADGLFQMGNIYHNVGDYSKALNTFYRIINIDKMLNNSLNVAHSLNSIGNIFFNTNRFDEAIATYNEVLLIYDSLNRERNKSYVFLNLGNVYTKLKLFNEAIEYYNKALQIDKKYSIMPGIALDLANIAYMFDGMRQYDSALVYHLRALGIREKLPDKDDLARSLIGVGRGYRLTGDNLLAEDHLAKALNLSKEIKSKPLIRDAYFNLAELYADEKEYSKAYEYHQLYTAMKDSVLNEETERQISELQTQYETEKKNQQISYLEKEKEAQQAEIRRQSILKKAFGGGFILLALLVTTIIYTSRQRLKNQKLLAEKNDQINEANFHQQMSELEMRALRAQINPHFMFNCMNSINVMILEGQAEKASLYLTKFSKLVRLILENSETDQVSLENELAMLEAYIQLEELRFQEKINYNISVDEQIEPGNTFLPSMILQPFVENAIWHGLVHKEEKTDSQIAIEVKEENGQLRCTIVDNGVGREKARILQQNSVWKTKSMGMKITEERLKLLNKEKLQELIHVTDLKDQNDCALGTRVDINISVA